jgi:hypothetical protein
MIDDLKILAVRFTQPIEVKGLGMCDLLRFDIDPDTGKPRNEGISATWMAAARAVRIVTKAGETWVPVHSIGSFQPLYEVRAANNTPIAKRGTPKIVLP